MNKLIILTTITAIVHVQGCAVNMNLIKNQYNDKIEQCDTVVCTAIDQFTNISRNLTSYVGSIVNETELETNVRIIYMHKFMC